VPLILAFFLLIGLIVIIQYNLLNIEYSRPVIFTNLRLRNSRNKENVKISGFTVLLNHVYVYYITYIV